MATHRRLSPFRLVVLLALVSVGATFATTQARSAWSRLHQPTSSTWYAPYVDVTAQPSFHFEDPVTSPARYHVLGFVVADPKAACLPTWGTYYDLDGAGRSLDLDRRIARLRERGGDAIVSFGGAANSELATTCASVTALTGAYRTVLRRYSSTIVDFDVEGTALANTAANERRAAALRILVDEAQAAGRPLHVWLTVPVTPAGMTGDALALITTTLRAGVSLDGVNLMAMDYGASRTAGQSIASATESALRASERQLLAAYLAGGVRLSTGQAWARIGATPMLGRNDTARDVFGLDDADALVALAGDLGLGRVSAWSENRDAPCSAAADGRVSTSCSGVAQDPLAFTWRLLRLNGPAASHTTTAPATVADVSRDDPATSPYAIWRTVRGYHSGEKVVWHGSVYEAKWWAQDATPDAPVANPWDTPWRYLGPVLASDRVPAPVPAATAGGASAAAWIADAVYLRGDHVSLGGKLYQARWWTQGDQPSPSPARTSDAPWALLGDALPDVAVVGDALPAWSGATVYEAGARVSQSGYVYEARWYTHGTEPKLTPVSPDSYPWAVVGRLPTTP
jgi:chitinase